MKKKIVIVVTAVVSVVVVGILVMLTSKPTSPEEVIETIKSKTGYRVESVSLATSESANLYMSGSLKINDVSGYIRLHKSNWEAEYRCQMSELCFTVNEWSIDYWSYGDDVVGEGVGGERWREIMERVNR